MPTIRFEKHALLDLLEKEVDEDVLQERISMLGTDLESFGDEVVVEIFPNRPDLLSVQGLARALNHFLGFTSTVDTYQVTKGDREVTILPSAADVRPHTRCAIIRGLRLDQAKLKHIIDIQEKLHVTFGRNRKKVAIGIYPLDKISGAITFGAEPSTDIVFTPLGEQKQMNAKIMLEEHETGKAFGHLLEGQEPYPVFRDEKGTVLSVPPIINSEEVGRVTIHTTDVFVECSGHQALPLEQALVMICSALSDMGGRIESVQLSYENERLVTPDMSIQTLKIDPQYVSQRSGVPASELTQSLEKMGLSLDEDVVTIPCYRTDFMHPVDVVEEAAIGYGYENIEARMPNVSTMGSVSQQTKTATTIRSVLVGLGMVEAMTWYLTPQGLPLSNPLTINHSHLRTELLLGLLGVLEKNTSNTYPQHIFEIGPVFIANAKSETRVSEEMRVAGVLSGEGVSYTTARQAVQALAQAMRLSCEFSSVDDERFIIGRSAEVSGDMNGIIGEIHPKQLSNRGVQFPTAAFELSYKK